MPYIYTQTGMHVGIHLRHPSKAYMYVGSIWYIYTSKAYTCGIAYTT